MQAEQKNVQREVLDIQGHSELAWGVGEQGEHKPKGPETYKKPLKWIMIIWKKIAYQSIRTTEINDYEKIA